jgi:hypothetical protein
MKKLIFVIVFCASCMFGETTFAQFSVRVNLASQPMWGPVGYDYVEYYYMPDIQVYYNVQRHRYVYMEHGRWVSRSYLPQSYRNYDVYNARKVVINERKPYLHHNTYKARYSETNDYSDQKSIRDSREVKYYQNKNHPEHKKWMNDQKKQKQYQKHNSRHNHDQRQSQYNNRENH